MDNSDDNIKNKNHERIRELVHTLEKMLLANDIVYDNMELDEELNACLIFISTKNMSAIDIPPLEQLVRAVHADLRAVIDSAEDQLCFFVVFK